MLFFNSNFKASMSSQHWKSLIRANPTNVTSMMYVWWIEIACQIKNAARILASQWEPCFRLITQKTNAPNYGCRMGDVSQLIVPRNSFVRVPSKTRGPQCHMVCYCNQDNEIEDCMTPSCIMTDPCWHEGKRYVKCKT
ncbi:UNVERIFIED_CONTAM: hypothetical protein NCL1_34381 [Trichonephila clavipes]